MNESSSRSLRASRAFVVAAIVGVVTLALVGCTTKPDAVVSSAPSAPRLALSVPLPGNVFSLAYDPTRDVIWYATITAAGPATLYEADLSTGKTRARFALPASPADGGPGEVVRVAPDGSIWVNEAYALVRVNPATGGVSSVRLPAHVEGELPGATGHSLSPGTWTTSMTITSNSVLLGRNNVPYLQQWSLGLQPLANVTLPEGDSAPSDMTTTRDGVVLEFRTVDGNGNANVHATLPFPAGSSSPATSAGLALQPGYLVYRPDGNTSELETTNDAPLVSLDFATHSLDWTTSSGADERIPWPVTKGKVGNPLGQLVTVTSEAGLQAALITPHGALWIVEQGDGASLREYKLS